jgi:predicted transcriptional regulator
VSQALSVRVSAETVRRLRRLSKTAKKPVSDLVRESLERFLSIQEFRSLRRKVLPFAEASGFLTDEDIFKALS